MEDLKQEIEQVRSQLYELVKSKKNQFTSREVKELSEHLDRLIVRYEKERASARRD